MMEATVAVLGTVVAAHIGAIGIATRSGIFDIPIDTARTVVAKLAAREGDLLGFLFLFHDSCLLINDDSIFSDGAPIAS